MQRRHFLHLPLTLITLTSIMGFKFQNSGLPIARGETVLALGDSMTFGYGVNSGINYPSFLAKMTGWNIINAGVPGDTTFDVLERFQLLLEQHTPRLVLTQIGWNDCFLGLPSQVTFDNVTTICKYIKDADILNMLIAMPLLVRDENDNSIHILDDNPIYKEIAQALNIPLQERGWTQAISQKDMRSDEIHGNAKGYLRFAELLAQSLREVGYLAPA